jgi:hypothetical protein
LEFPNPTERPGGAFNSPPAPGTLPPAPASVPYADRSTGLLIFGILEIIGGVFAFLMIPLMLLGMVIGRKAGAATPASSMVTGALTYAGLAVVLLILGIGATQAKRWAWALNLIVSWMWLIGGALVTIMLVFVLPESFLAGMKQAAAQNPNRPAMSPGVMAVILTIMIVLMAVFLVVLPLAFLLFYRSKNVELTCKDRDPVERWTDRIPLPVLAYALLATVGCLYFGVVGFTTPMFPFFGRYITGLPATSVMLAFALVDGFVAVSLFRMKVAGWWVAVIAMGLRVVSTLFTLGRGNLLEAYSRLGWSQKQLEIMSKNPMFRGNAILWWTVAFTLCYFVFLIWLRRYFRPSASPNYTGITGGPSANQAALGS